MYCVSVKCGCCPKRFEEREVNLSVSLWDVADKIQDDAYKSGWDLLLGYSICCPECVRIDRERSLVVEVQDDGDDVPDEVMADFQLVS